MIFPARASAGAIGIAWTDIVADAHIYRHRTKEIRDKDQAVSDDDTAVQAWASARAAPREGAASLGSFPMRPAFKQGPEHLAAIARVKEWTRARFNLPQEATILVSQVTCALPGCPPLETVVAFWPDAATRHRFKIFKPVCDVTTDDLPFTWLKDSLVMPEGFGCDCC